MDQELWLIDRIPHFSFHGAQVADQGKEAKMHGLQSAIAALGICLAATAAQAADEQVSFRYDPAELVTGEGASAVRERIRRIARLACYEPAFVPRKLVRQCRQDIESDLVAQIDGLDRVRVAEADEIDRTGA